ncbi:MAG: hypothetical protein IPJ00_17215 [Saprospirales bacterium]|nr:hypothetical protein [Saprospirales bacterium]
MNKYLVLLSIAIFGLSACQKQASEEDQLLVQAIAESPNKALIEPASLPEAIVENFREDHFQTFIAEAYHSPSYGYEVVSGDEDHFFFNLNGRPLMEEERGWREREFRRFGGPCGEPGRPVNLRRLPSAVKRYINDNYPDDSANRAKILADGTIVVAMDPPLLLVFTEAGRFIEEVFCVRPCGGAMWRIRVDQLPEALTEYLRLNYNGLEALASYECRNGNFVVGLFIDGQRLMLVFDSEGNFLYVRGGKLKSL